MGIRSKLLINAIASILCVAIVGMVGFFFTDRVAEDSETILHKQAFPIIDIYEIESQAWEYMVRLIFHTAVAEPEEMEKIQEEMARLKKSFNTQLAEFEKIYTDKDEHIRSIQERWIEFEKISQRVLELSNDYTKEDALQLIVTEGSKEFNNLLSASEKNIVLYKQEMATLGEKAKAAKKNSGMFMLLFTAFAAVSSFFGGIWIMRSIEKPLGKVITGLQEGSVKVRSASKEVLSLSGILAQDSAKQAASLEETSSSLNEISSMIQNTAEYAQEADQKMKGVNRIVDSANLEMTELIESMNMITKAGEETFKINKTIDEIAFQTNLLALNAAVEAARAGDAGAGFAVVADEVRNLALRATQASKNTAELLDETLTSIKKGSSLVIKTNESFMEVGKSAVKVGEIIGEIAASTREQAQGIDQVNIAMSEIDKVVQSNTANAEESADSSKVMNRQSEFFMSFVEELASISGWGKIKSNGFNKTQAKDVEPAFSSELPPRKPNLQKIIQEKGDMGNEKMIIPKREVGPQEIIPLDDDDF